MPVPSHCDPAKGVFETLLVVDGRPVELDAHLERLAGSLTAVFATSLPAEPRKTALDASRGIALGRLRLIASPEPNGQFVVTATADPIEPEQSIRASSRTIKLQTSEVPGGFGAHKWVDRALLERAEREAFEGTAPLLLDSDGTVLESSRANVFALCGGVLRTPPTDGRIVPGITRRRVIELASAAGHRVREEPLSTRELLAAEEVFLTNSIRAVQPVRAIDDVRLPSSDVHRLDGPNADPTRGTSAGGRTEGGGVASPGSVTAELAEALRRCWLDQAAPAAAVATSP